MRPALSRVTAKVGHGQLPTWNNAQNHKRPAAISPIWHAVSILPSAPDLYNEGTLCCSCKKSAAAWALAAAVMIARLSFFNALSQLSR